MFSRMKKPFRIVRINTKQPIGSRKELLAKFAASKDPVERAKMLQDAKYPNMLKSTEE